MALIGNGRTAIVVVTSDRHPNDWSGLFNERGIVLDTGGRVYPTEQQVALWRYWQDFWQIVASVKREQRAPVTWYDLGDGADLNKYSAYVLVSPSRVDLTRIAVATFEPALPVIDEFAQVRGTFAHTGQDAELEELVCERLALMGVNVYTADAGGRKQFSHYRIRREHSGIRFDLAHPPRSNSTRPWTAGGGANRTAEMIEAEYMAHRVPYDRWPHYALRGHVHHIEDSGWNHSLRCLFCMPWKLHGSYEQSRQFSAGAVGGYIFICRDGQCMLGRVTYDPDRGRQIWFG